MIDANWMIDAMGFILGSCVCIIAILGTLGCIYGVIQFVKETRK